MSNRRSSKMPSHLLCGSATYVWSTASVLGKGATGAVYQGINKVTGEAVAVKTFNHLSHMRPDHVQMREFEVLKKVKTSGHEEIGHENIVRLLAIEQEQGTDNKVLVMELCTGGSLFNILDDPENTYGVQESEFLLVLEHVSAGMKHLRDKNIVHRDLKPGNIMKFITADGRSIYKLTDFGAARELPDDQQFMSLYGTEEYLHPDMYERAVLRKSPNKTFGATVDLWSIGVTLYHVATGSLPFRPYGGRKNKEIMHFITTGKESGIISGVQLTDKGKIEWSRRLPDTCQLSMGLQKLVTPLLAGLLESNSAKIWTFDHFFSAVTDILSYKNIHVFNINCPQMHHIYIKDLKMEVFQNLLREQTDVVPQSQLLMFDNKIFFDGGIMKSPVSSTELDITTSREKPVFLFKRGESVVDSTPTDQIPKYPSLSTEVSVESDAAVSKMICSSVHSLKRSIEKTCASVKLMNAAALMFFEILKVQTLEVKISLTNSEALLDRDIHRTQLLSSCSKFCGSMIDIFLPDNAESSSKNLKECVTAKEESGHTVSDHLQSLIKSFGPLSNRILNEKRLFIEWTTSCSSLSDISRCPLTAATLVQRIKESWQALCKDRNARALSYNEEQFHILEKAKIVEASHQILNLYKKECLEVYKKASDITSKWLEGLTQDYTNTVQLLDSVSSFQDMLMGHKQSLDGAELVFDGALKDELQRISQEWSLQKEKTMNKSETLTGEDLGFVFSKQKSRQLLRERLKELSNLHLEVLDETRQNKLLISQFKSLLSSKTPIKDVHFHELQEN